MKASWSLRGKSWRDSAWEPQKKAARARILHTVKVIKKIMFKEGKKKKEMKIPLFEGHGRCWKPPWN